MIAFSQKLDKMRFHFYGIHVKVHICPFMNLSHVAKSKYLCVTLYLLTAPSLSFSFCRLESSPRPLSSFASTVENESTGELHTAHQTQLRPKSVKIRGEG